MIFLFIYKKHKSLLAAAQPGNGAFPGPDVLQPTYAQIAGDGRGEFIQDSAEVLQSHCIQERPDGWKVANLMSLFKIGSGNTSGNYRPFSFDSFVAGGRGLKKHFRRLNGDI